MIALGRAGHPILPLFFMGYKMCKSNVSIAQKGGDTLYKKKEVEKLREASTVYTIYRVGGRETITRENKKLEGGSRKNGKLLIERVN
jgi:predicted  nucleic acid-binding Zn ribbon protein